MQCITAKLTDHDSLIYCTREHGHTGPHVGEDDGESVQWKESESAQPRTFKDAEPVNAWQLIMPSAGQTVTVCWDRHTPQTFLVDAIVCDEGGGPRAVRFVDDNDPPTLIVVPWERIGSIEWAQS